MNRDDPVKTKLYYRVILAAILNHKERARHPETPNDSLVSQLMSRLWHGLS